MLARFSRFLLSLSVCLNVLCSSILPVHALDAYNEIAATGDYTFDPGTGTIISYNGTERNVVIPSEIGEVKVRTIANEAFASRRLTAVTIPDSVTQIQYRAFYDNQLTDIDIPNSVVEIGQEAFYCNQLSTVSLPDTLTTIAQSAFEYNQLMSISIPDSVTTIGKYAFFQNVLTGVTIPDSVTTIAGFAFGNNNLSSLILGNAVTEIGEYAFANNSLTDLTIPESVRNIREKSFTLNLFTQVFIPESVVFLSPTAFDENVVVDWPHSGSDYEFDADTGTILSYNGTERNVVIPSEIGDVKVRTIANEAFASRRLTAVTIPDSVTQIQYRAFYDNQLTDIDIPNSVVEIGQEAFYCNQLSSVRLPDTLTSIAQSAFEHNQLMSISIPNSVTTIGRYAFFENLLTGVTIPDQVTTIDGFAFGNNNLSSLILGNAVAEIGEQAFVNNSLTDLTIPESVRYIREKSFTLNLFTQVFIPESVVFLSPTAFDENVVVDWPHSGSDYEFDADTGTIISYNGTERNVVIPSEIGDVKVRTIANEAFASRRLTAVTIPESVTQIQYRAFYDNQLTDIDIPNSVVEIGQEAFYCNQLSTVRLPDTLTTIAQSAFEDNQLMSISIPDSVTTIGRYAFFENLLTGVTIPDSVTTIDGFAFGNNNLSSLVLGNAVAEIGEQAFINNSLTDLILPESLRYIREKSFTQNPFTRVFIPESVVFLSPIAFDAQVNIVRFSPLGIVETAVTPDQAVLTRTPLVLSQRTEGGAGTSLYKFTVMGSDASIISSSDFGEANTFTWTPVEPDTYTLVFEARDELGNTDRVERELTVELNPYHIAVFRAGWSDSYETGETVHLAARAEGGTAPYRYQFYVLRSNGRRVNFRKNPVFSNIYPWIPVTPDTYTLGVDVYDATGQKVTEEKTITVTNHNPFWIEVFRAGWSDTYELGQTIDLAARAEGGTAPYKYQFYVLRSNGRRVNFRKNPVFSNIYPWTPSTPDTYTLGVDVFDATGRKVNRVTTITVKNDNPLSIASFRAGYKTEYTPGETLALEARGEGGTAPYQYQFYVIRSNGSKVVLRKYASSNTFSWSPVTPDTYKLGVAIRDAKERVASKEVTVTVK
ncbi:MAG: leucine-rich repeat protein [Bacillota bacterium]|nr:leucine-rich repeat protein [Bacillota bacterium]